MTSEALASIASSARCQSPARATVDETLSPPSILKKSRKPV